MDSIRLEGGPPLRGSVQISGAKNAALPILTAALLAKGEHTFRNVPSLRDVHTMVSLLRQLGLPAQFADGVAKVTGVDANLIDPIATYDLVKQMRASVLVLGPLVARCGHARVSLPGGCAIGARPIDEHLKGLEAMGAEVTLDHGYVDVRVPSGRLRGAEIHMGFPSHTGTENLMAAAALAKGTTVIHNAAREPEVEDLGLVLTQMGARVTGAGTSTITIEGVDELATIDHAIMPDRIEAGTMMVAAAVTHGDVLVRGAQPSAVRALMQSMRAANVIVEPEADGVRVASNGPIKPIDIITAPHPGFPTDMQAQFMILMTLAEGTSHITETVFENRFMHVSELGRMGAKISIHGQTATVRGVPKLQGADVMATDLRASASLVVAGLVAEGETVIRRVYHLDRGYERMEQKLGQLGAKIARVPGEA